MKLLKITLKMKKTYQLIKLKTETVQDLKRLMRQTGKGSLDDLIMTLIRLMDTHRHGLKDVGWDIYSKRRCN
jgi:hypothetical protein